MLSTVRSVCFYFFYLILPIVISLTLKFAAYPRRRGFFCLDDSIRYPYVSDTVKWLHAGLLAALPPLFLIFVDGVCRHVSGGAKMTPTSSAKNATKNAAAASSSASASKRKLAEVMLPCAIAFVANGLYLNATVDIGKFGFGRLRPHFLSVCQPSIYNGSLLLGSCADLAPRSAHLFVSAGEEGEGEEGLWYKCPGESSRVKKARQSFPSGHSAALFYAMTYAFVYLQTNAKRLPLIRNLLQFVCVITALGVSLSRIVDHAHHAEDVLVGATLGVLAASHAIINPLPVARERGASGVDVEIQRQNNEEEKMEHQF